MSEAEGVEKIKSELSAILSEIVNYNFLTEKGWCVCPAQLQSESMDDKSKCGNCDKPLPSLEDAAFMEEESERDTEEECQLFPLDEEPRCPHCGYADSALSDAISLAEEYLHSPVTEWKCPSCDENYRVTALRQEDEKLAEADMTLTDNPICPHCGHKDEEWWDSREVRLQCADQTEWNAECPKCGKDYSVIIHLLTRFTTRVELVNGLR